MITLQIAGQDIEIKADTGAEATVIPYHLHGKRTKRPLQKIQQPLKGWLASKPIPPKGCVYLPTQHKNRQVDLFTLLLMETLYPHWVVMPVWIWKSLSL